MKIQSWYYTNFEIFRASKPEDGGNSDEPAIVTLARRLHNLLKCQEKERWRHRQVSTVTSQDNCKLWRHNAACFGAGRSCTWWIWQDLSACRRRERLVCSCERRNTSTCRYTTSKASSSPSKKNRTPPPQTEMRHDHRSDRTRRMRSSSNSTTGARAIRRILLH